MPGQKNIKKLKSELLQIVISLYKTSGMKMGFSGIYCEYSCGEKQLKEITVQIPQTIIAITLRRKLYDFSSDLVVQISSHFLSPPLYTRTSPFRVHVYSLHEF